MAIKLRPPKKDEERLTWCKGIKVAVCTEDGLQKGEIDVQFAVLNTDGLNHEINDSGDKRIPEFLRERIRSVRGFKDDENKEWPESEQIEFVCTSTEVTFDVYTAYLQHTTGGRDRKKGSRN